MAERTSGETIRHSMSEAIIQVTNLLQELDRSNVTGEINLHMTDRCEGDEGADIRLWLHIGGSIGQAQATNNAKIDIEAFNRD